MDKIIDPIGVDVLRSELTPDKKICDTNKAGNEIYVVDGHDSPNVLMEIGRLREIAFRNSGGGSGMAYDLDEFDTMQVPYKQIVIWDPEAGAIIGGYRYILGPDVKFTEDGQPLMTSSHLFHYSKEFIEDYLPHVMELGRSFVTPAYQSSKAGAKAIFALDNLWDGICTVIMHHPQIMFFIGKMSIYQNYDKACLALITRFLWKHFPDPDFLARPRNPMPALVDDRLLDLILRDEDFKADFRNLKDAVHRLGSNIPPLVNSYMHTSPSIRMLGTAYNDEFSDLIETGILVGFNDMYADKVDRHKEPYFSSLICKLKDRFPYFSDEKIQRMVAHNKEKRTKLVSRLLLEFESRRGMAGGKERK